MAMNKISNEEPLWRPSASTMERSNMAAFIRSVRQDHPQVTNYDSLYRWSIDRSDQFWSEFWRFSGIRSSRAWDDILIRPDAMPGAAWFPGARLNYAENLLRYRDDRVALIGISENRERRSVTYGQLYREVARCRTLLESQGIKPGDRVAGYMANTVETIVAMLAASSLGAIWSSCSPDFGVKGVLERFSQIEPRILFAVDGYRYNGKPHSILPQVASVADRISSIERVVIVPFLDPDPDLSSMPGGVLYEDAVQEGDGVLFRQLPFDHPLYVLYSSGTTGKPKCIAHGAGGTLIQHLKEQQLHTDLKRDDVLFFFTTCGWMMWNWLASGLASGCTLVLYDGSPFYPDKGSLWKMAQELGVTIFGTSARYLGACAKEGLAPKAVADLSALRTVLSTGSPLASEGFDYVYSQIKSDVMLSSISGGTDIISCFVLGNPLRPVYRGEIQCRGLGMAVDVYEEGKPVRGRRGELVCTRPFPSMPLGFWNEPDHARYHKAYFERFPGVWTQGDYAEITEHEGMIIYGRSDAVLNPGGVRIGTAEIYRQVEKVEEVLESLCIAQEWEQDVRIVLFVMLREGAELTHDLESTIRSTIRLHASPRHVPAKILAVRDIPRTLSGKITELAVRSVVHGEPVGNTEALANPEALEFFRDREELKHA